MLKIAIIAGEPSGDMLAAQLMQELSQNSPVPIAFMGIGGQHMAAQGLKSSFNMDILAVGGYGWDVIKAVPQIYRIYRQISHQILEFKPDVFIGVDAPDFNFHVEKKLKQHGIKTVHYISPTIWAWRYERIFKIKRSTDLMLCIFPMEESLYVAEGIKAKFIGHHLADQIELDINTNHYKDKLQLSGIVFSILVGSRTSEVNSLASLFIATCNLIASHIPNATFLFPLVNQAISDKFVAILKAAEVKFSYRLLVNQTSEAVKASDMVLAKSGTVTLEVALCKKPLIISYKISKFTEWLIRRKIKIKYVGQPNILLNEEVAPELLQAAANPQNLAKHFIDLYYDQPRQQYMKEKFYALHHQLRHKASEAGAQAILELIYGTCN